MFSFIGLFVFLVTVAFLGIGLHQLDYINYVLKYFILPGSYCHSGNLQ
jgi:hypothetical protein